jgi:hypothetical protein
VLSFSRPLARSRDNHGKQLPILLAYIFSTSSRILGEIEIGEMGLGKTGLGEMGLGEMGEPSLSQLSDYQPCSILSAETSHSRTLVISAVMPREELLRIHKNSDVFMMQAGSFLERFRILNKFTFSRNESNSNRERAKRSPVVGPQLVSLRACNGQ